MSLSFAEAALFYEKYKNLRKQDVLKIFKWLEKNPHLPTMTEFQVILFLIRCSYNVDFATKAIQNYFSFKAKSDIFVMIDEILVKRSTSEVFVGVFPNETSKNEKVVLLKFLKSNSEKYNCEECAKYLLNAVNLYLHVHGPSNGFILVMDSENLTFGHFWKMKLSVVRQVLYYVQEVAPVLIKGIHFINVLPVTKHLIACFKPFLKQEFYELIKIHSSSIDSLYEYVPKICLPEEYGGELESYHIINEETTKNVLENMKLLEWINAQNIDESKKKAEKKKRFFSSVYNYFS